MDVVLTVVDETDLVLCLKARRTLVLNHHRRNEIRDTSGHVPLVLGNHPGGTDGMYRFQESSTCPYYVFIKTSKLAVHTAVFCDE